MNYLFNNNQQKEEPKKVEVRGEFECFSCYEVVTTGMIKDGMLIYTCDEGHDTSIAWGQQEFRDE